MPITPRTMRSDANRNHEAILIGAIAVLAESPQASMREIADASGTGRTTLYRHFPDRQALVGAIYERVLNEADEITAAHLDAGARADPVQVLGDLAVALAGLGDRHRFLEQYDAAVTAKDPDYVRRRGGRLRDYLRAAQRKGQIRKDLTVDWMFAVVVALVTEAAGHHFGDRGGSTRDAMLRATIRSLLAPLP
jgi:AcrR family transcriptional regulator